MSDKLYILTCENTMKHLAMIVRDDSLDKIMVPIASAHLQASEGCKVDMLFLSWAVNALKEGGSDDFKIQSAHADKEEWIRDRINSIGMTSDIYEMLKMLKATGNVNFYACSMAASVFEINEKNIIDEAQGGIVGLSWFLNDVASVADHCQYW